MKKMPLSEAIRFHGHLGPWLVIGIRMGEVALKRLSAKKHFGIDVRAAGALTRPKSCLIDGLQLATGATYGKGNIKKYPSTAVTVTFRNTATGRSLTCRLTQRLLAQLNEHAGHAAGEALARRLYYSRTTRGMFTMS